MGCGRDYLICKHEFSIIRSVGHTVLNFRLLEPITLNVTPALCVSDTPSLDILEWRIFPLMLVHVQSGFSGNVIVLSVLCYGGIMVSDSTLTVGNLSAFLLYAGYIGVSIGGLSSFYSEMNRGLGASTRLWELLDRVPGIPVSGDI